MLECFEFIFKCIADFIKLLFTIEIGFTNLGVLICICNIFFPIVLMIVNFLKHQIKEERDLK